MIGQTLLGDAEAERSFELMPQSRVMLRVIECRCSPIGEEKDENLFSESQLEEDDLNGHIRQAKFVTVRSNVDLGLKDIQLPRVTEHRPCSLTVQLVLSFITVRAWEMVKK